MKQWHCLATDLAMDEDAVAPPNKKRKGGNQQRLAAAQAALDASSSNVPTDQTPSLLEDHLVSQWAWGKYSPQEIQLLANLAKRDMEAMGVSKVQSSLASLASMGSSGKHANNCHRDLMKLVNDKSWLPQPLQVVMPFKPADFVQSVMLPHLVFHALYTHYPAFWAACFLPLGVKGLVAFWNLMASHPCMVDFQSSKHKWQKWTIPLNLHGDAVPTIGCGKVWSKMLQAYSWTGLLSKGSTKQRSFFIWGATKMI